MTSRLEARTRVRESIQEVLYTPPGTAPTLNPTAGGSLSAGAYRVAVVFVYSDGRSELGPRTSATATSTNNAIALTAVAVGSTNSGVIARQIWRSKTAGTSFFLDTTINDNDTTTATLSKADASLGEPYKTFRGYVTDDAINYWLSHYNRYVAAKTGCLIHSESISVSTNASTLATTFPVLRFHKTFRASWTGGSYGAGRLTPVDMRDIDKVEPDWDVNIANKTGTPLFVFRKTKVGTTLNLFPIPDATGSASVTYHTLYNELSADADELLADSPSNIASTTLDPYANSVIYNAVGEIVRAQGRRPEATSEYFQLAQTAIQEIMQHTEGVLDESEIPYSPSPYPTTHAQPIDEEESIPSSQAPLLSQQQGRRAK